MIHFSNLNVYIVSVARVTAVKQQIMNIQFKLIKRLTRDLKSEASNSMSDPLNEVGISYAPSGERYMAHTYDSSHSWGHRTITAITEML